MRTKIRLMVLLCVVGLLGGCLTTQYKEYRFTLQRDGSGTGSITFVNIVSDAEDGEDVSFSDFGELIDNYIEGTQFENDNPHFEVSKKTLCEKDGMLCGVVEFSFESADSVGFWRYPGSADAPWMYYLGSLSETLVETNGTYLGKDRDIPMLYWESDATEIYFKTNVTEKMDDAHSLLSRYTSWKKDR